MCTNKDICELWNQVEAFAFQYEMHASSYQRDIATAQQVAKENGALEDCTRGKYLSTIILRLRLF